MRALPSPKRGAWDSAVACSSPPLAAATSASTRGRVIEVDREVAVGDLAGLAQHNGAPALEQHRAVAKAVDGAHVMGDEHDRAARVAHLVEDVKALLLERRVADCQHLVDQQDVGLDLDRHREGETDVHARRSSS